MSVDVIPAEAGIQNLASHFHGNDKNQIPDFSGMTVMTDFVLNNICII